MPDKGDRRKGNLSDQVVTTTPDHMWRSIRTSNPIEQFIGKIRAWTSKFNYFHGKANLELAMFTYLSFKKDELVPDKILPHFKNYTLFVA